jgi:hypothetical protein
MVLLAGYEVDPALLFPSVPARNGGKTYEVERRHARRPEIYRDISHIENTPAIPLLAKYNFIQRNSNVDVIPPSAIALICCVL